MNKIIVQNESGEFFKVINETLYSQYETENWNPISTFEGFTKGDIINLQYFLGDFKYDSKQVQDSFDLTEELSTWVEESNIFPVGFACDKHLNTQEKINKYGITENDLKENYKEFFKGDYLTQCNLEELLELMVSNINQ